MNKFDQTQINQAYNSGNPILYQLVLNQNELIEAHNALEEEVEALKRNDDEMTYEEVKDAIAKQSAVSPYVKGEPHA